MENNSDDDNIDSTLDIDTSAEDTQEMDDNPVEIVENGKGVEYSMSEM